jgi:hypothetical protein
MMPSLEITFILRKKEGENSSLMGGEIFHWLSGRVVEETGLSWSSSVYTEHPQRKKKRKRGRNNNNNKK